MPSVSESRERLARLQVVACRLAHERACWKDGRTVSRQSGDETILVRPLCGATIRHRRLSCAHTGARNTAARALVELRSAGALTEEACAAFLDELQALGQQIHLLDHRKGDAEKVYACAVEAAQREGDACGDASIEALKSSVKAMESEHDGYVERLRDWRERVLAALS